jgi:inosine-uridine nucleoside N-ribohydrolase
MKSVWPALLSFWVAGCYGPNRGPVPGLPPAARSAPMPVVLSTDCGVDVDDQWALAHLLLSPEFDLRGIVTTHASSVQFSSAASARCASDVLQRVAPRKAIVITPGSDVPLQQASTARDSAAADLIVHLSQPYTRSQRLVVLSTGAATEIAGAILEDPSITDRIVLVAMGFVDWPRGGDEFNIKNDPVAWQVILDSDVPLIVGSSDVTKRDLRLTSPQSAALMRSHGGTGEYLSTIFDEWIARNADLVARVVAPGTWVIWDEVVVAYALNLASGNVVARPHLEPDLSFSHPRTNARITWLTRIETNRVWRDFTTKLDANPSGHR